jgi:hypothetical protein
LPADQVLDVTMLYIPAGFARGFQTLTVDVVVEYLMGIEYVEWLSDGLMIGIKCQEAITVLSARMRHGRCLPIETCGEPSEPKMLVKSETSAIDGRPGRDLDDLIGGMFPINCGQTGAGVRKTLAIVARHIDLDSELSPETMRCGEFLVPGAAGGGTACIGFGPRPRGCPCVICDKLARTQWLDLSRPMSNVTTCPLSQSW